MLNTKNIFFVYFFLDRQRSYVSKSKLSGMEKQLLASVAQAPKTFLGSHRPKQILDTTSGTFLVKFLSNEFTFLRSQTLDPGARF